ncbi:MULTISPECIES: glycine--tRNA ligase [unclassified Crossiella]|uniref:glycine--tRNA ligase n=1 Tax=unclassified Crossiella TaxID=2620835 RepID=UPI001FFF05E9|nr:MULTISPECIES: glycine--tRNA ligase [unclassified Crossiella]MCK2241527.1 glycine--tRNA ligase [Crossiella sp. S99.2]MCK2255601.1 glycine--tRNA ligase [Crossiella sp. S99.1]
MPTMQDVLLALTNYWTSQGCLVVQPVNSEVGAGTLNPATILRVLGPEPWRVSYVEPSVRPDDSRYGENPNRLQTHTQFQVLLKPDPGHAQELYLGSLAAIGVDVAAHDIRFVEDNWASPALGAWGLGWEVWLDGLEITQFTYFQQAGGQTLDPVSVEITYGVERIMMAVQGVEHFKDIAYAPGISYGEAFGQAEYELSRYYLDEADVPMTRELFEAQAAEARRLLDRRLPVPAHGCVLRCSHLFNVLDARGAVSATERAQYFGRMRALAREVAQLWAERRAELGHPLGSTEFPPPATLPEVLPEVTEPATLVFEIGVEELPPAEVTRTVAAVRDALARRLGATRLAHGEIRVHGTPRRIVAVVDAVAPREIDAERTVRGPGLDRSYVDGVPTKAALGFARGQGVAVEELERIGEHVGVRRIEPGRGAVTVLSELLAHLVGELRAEQNMRWHDPALSFARPIRWLLALLGDTEIPLAVSTVAGGRTTRVHRSAPRPVVEVPDATGYLDFLKQHNVIADADERRRLIVEAATALAKEVGGVPDFGVLAEVVNLVESPTTILGGFDPAYLELPPEILTTVMRKHQRYLAVRDAEGVLLPHFLAVANGDCVPEVVRAGNEAVLRARYEDAAFFWRADLTRTPDSFRAGLAALTFADRLGSMADRADRIAAVATELAAELPVDRDVLRRAGELAKFDLATHLVVELPALAGVMARDYARRAGESEAVAQALFDLELPRTATDDLPATTPGALLALADRFDLLAGLFSVGAAPTGSSDPFGLRRAALGILAILRARPELPLTLDDGLRAAARQLHIDLPAQARDFLLRRYEQQLLDAGHDHRRVAAVLPLAASPATADATLRELVDLSADPGFANLVAALQRVRRIVPPGTTAEYDPARLVDPAEIALHQAVSTMPSATELAGFARAATVLIDPVTRFFDDVLVLVDDPVLRATRLGLLARIRDRADRVLDWSAL